MFKLALERLPSDRDCARSRPSPGWRTCPTSVRCCAWRAPWSTLYCGTFRQVPRRITLDIDDTFDAVHGGQQLRLFNAHYDEYGFQPIVVFDGEGRFVTAMLRPARRPNGAEIRAFLRRLVRAIRAHWPRVEILIRADSHYCRPEVLDFCRANGSTSSSASPPPARCAAMSPAWRPAPPAGQGGAGRGQAAPLQGVPRRRHQLEPGRAHHRPRRGRPRGHRHPLRRHQPRHGSGRSLYEDLYCRRGQAENHIKAWKTHLAADRTSCRKATANQFRLFLHAGAYWLLWTLRALMPRRSSWRVAQFDTLRVRLIKIATRVVEMKSKIMLHLPTSAPDQAVLHLALGRLPRLII